ncbi:MAG: ATP-binding protein [Deferrisomatales bacterium]
MRPEAAAPALASAYLEADRDVRLRLARVGCLFAITLMPAGSSLDYFVYPELLWPIFRIRMVSVFWAAAVLGVLYTPVGRRYVRLWGVLWVLVPAGAIAWMVYASQGSASPYYAGLNIAMIAVCMLMPWTFWEAVVTCATIIALYLAACGLHRTTPFDASIFFNNVYFLVLTAVICVTTCYFTSRRRFQEFRLRHEVADRNRELAESYRKLAELDRLKSEFFANVSHELRTPLTLILSPVEDLLRRGGLSEALAQALGTVRDNGLRLLRLINDLLELVRLEDGRARIDLQVLDLATFAPAIAESVRHVAERKGLTLAVRGGPGPLTVLADHGRLEKVLLNLLVNAVKFTPPSGSVAVEWRREGERAVVEVSDTGIGIPEGHLPHVFDRFRQADGSTTRRYQGAGLGLALARELVEEHGGTLTAASRVGRGTTLRLELPLGGEPTGALPAAPQLDLIAQTYRAADRFVAPEDASPRQMEAEVGAGEFTVLVVEDEPDLRRFLVATLAEEYRVLQAGDGETGLALARERHPHLVLLDLMLPGVDGLEVCSAIKGSTQPGGTRVVLLTARTDEAARISALERGADDFLVKPFSTLELRTRLTNLLQAARLEREVRERNVALEDALARLQQAEAQLVQTEKMNALGSLAAGLLHEINNPLNYTLTALQLAGQLVPEGDGEVREMLADIGEGMERIRDIVSSLREFAYPSAGGMSQTFDLAGSLDTALRLVSHEVSGVTVVRDLAPGCPVVGNRTQVTHVLVNLLSNAAKALADRPEGRAPEIRVAARPDGGRLRVTVWDNGPGIEAQNLGRVFDPFYTTRPVGQGMGLGLSICHTITRNHGGSMVAQSQPGQWTEIGFDLPLAPTGRDT